MKDRLHLSSKEFNSVPQAGRSNKEVLTTMLDECNFAFLIMTAEDQHNDQTMHARENVIHEIGLFQSHFGFEKAIILLEEGCSEFSNIQGITQIRFKDGNIGSVFLEISDVLKRENII